MSYMGDLSDTQIFQDAQVQLRSWKRQHDNVVCIDTDGCVFDNMWAKQVGVFQPLFMDFFNLRAIEPHFRIHAEHHNLWGKTRGADRFLAYQAKVDSLLEDPALPADSPHAHLARIKKSIDRYVEWAVKSKEHKLGVPSLIKFHQLNGTDYFITALLAWSEAVNRSFEYTTIKMPPFKYVKETLETIARQADILVISSTPYGDLKSWWENTGLKKYLTTIGSKEMGAKVEMIEIVLEVGAYDKNHALMIGDGGKDKTAGLDNGIHFLGTVPGKEEEIWRDSLEQVFKPLFKGEYGGSAYNINNIKEFDHALKEKGPWQLPGYNITQEYKKLQQHRVDTYQDLNLDGETLLTL